MSEHVCFVYSSESVNGTNAGRKSLAEDKRPDVPAAVPADASSSKDKAPEPILKEDARYQEKRDAALALCRAKNDRTRKLAASQQSPYTTNSTARVIIPNKKLYPDYNPFVPIDKKKLKELVDWLKTCLHYRTPLDKKPRTSRTWWYQILRTSLDLLCRRLTSKSRLHIDACINVLRKRHYTIILPIEQGFELRRHLLDCYVDIDP
ncbi:BnaCnng58770D [Brassica napus]|uniref:BnaCnng58770D protein n=1 Tax=Brassica napus TaxID=3708 RepID=A0A078JLL0_BRANA|nr:BnaCnng58770D [Brassica napus]